MVACGTNRRTPFAHSLSWMFSIELHNSGLRDMLETGRLISEYL